MNRIKTTSMFPTPASGNSSHMIIIYRILCGLVCNEDTNAELARKTSVNTWVHAVNHTKHITSEFRQINLSFCNFYYPKFLKTLSSNLLSKAYSTTYVISTAKVHSPTLKGCTRKNVTISLI